MQSYKQAVPLLRAVAPALFGGRGGAVADAAATCASWRAAASAAAVSQQHQQQRAAYASAAAASQAPPNAMALIKELRERSGAPISDVKACLAAAGWRLDEAYDGLRKKGLAAAAKKASRHAADGLVGLAAAPGGAAAAIVEVNSETDFVGRSALFRRLVADAAAAALAAAARSPVPAAMHQIPEAELRALRVPSPSGYVNAADDAADSQQQQQPTAAAAAAAGDASLEDAAAEVAAKVRENVRARRGYWLRAPPGGVVGGYVHQPAAPGLGRIAAAVALEAAGGGAIPEVSVMCGGAGGVVAGRAPWAAWNEGNGGLPRALSLTPLPPRLPLSPLLSSNSSPHIKQPPTTTTTTTRRAARRPPRSRRSSRCTSPGCARNTSTPPRSPATRAPPRPRCCASRRRVAASRPPSSTRWCRGAWPSGRRRCAATGLGRAVGWG